jgi:hypothetical protein
MARSLKRLHLLAAAAAGLGAVVVVVRMGHAQRDAIELVEATAHKPARGASAADAGTAHASVSASLLRLGAREGSIPSTEGNAFAVLSWLPPAPPPSQPAPPPPAAPPAPPAAPPLPLTFVGMVEQGAGKPRAFLAKGDALLVVASGDVIENGVYRVDSLSPTSVVLTYLPLNKQQTIQVSGSAP